MSTAEILLTVAFAIVAVLYASVGHAGASGYIAAMALAGLAPELMRPTALLLNLLVAAVATVRFYRAGCFRGSLFWPFALTSVPAAFVGGAIALPDPLFKSLVGAVLIYSAVHILLRPRLATIETQDPPRALALGIGLGLGFLSGLTGVGGGIFLSPLLLIAGWATPRLTSGVAAPFILVNSAAGLLGIYWKAPAIFAGLPTALPIWAAVVLLGGWIGAGFGSRIAGSGIRRLLAVVLIVAGIKLLFQV